jgi:hypothetical protein
MALSFVQAASAQNPTPGGQKLRTVFHPPLCSGKEQGFPITEAYPASSSTFTASDRPTTGANRLCLEVQRNGRWCGMEFPEGDNTTAAPGAFALCTRNVSTTDIRQRIDINRFATCPTGFGNAFVQNYRLIKTIPQSNKCPGVYQAQTYVQFGSNIRTWWTLIYTSPGTMFTLELTVVCQRLTFPYDVEMHVDRWKWTVVVTFESLERVIDVLHSNALSTSEIPCIAAENMYIALRQSVVRIRNANNRRNTTDVAAANAARQDAQNEIFNLEALIIAFCAFADCFDGTSGNPGGVFFQTFPPSNDTQMALNGMLTGVLDTPENPCCCKLLVDVERLAEAYEIVSL